jgi:hypothetical protein
MPLPCRDINPEATLCRIQQGFFPPPAYHHRKTEPTAYPAKQYMSHPSTRAGVWAKPCPAPTHSTAVEKAIATKHGNCDSSANANWIEPDETLRQAVNCQLNSFVDSWKVAT